MTHKALTALLLLLLVHFLFDFALQPDRWVVKKRENKFFSLILLRHSLLHGLFSYLVLCNWTGWQLPVLIFALHYLIDMVKALTRDSLQSFLLDQGAHLAVIILLWISFYNIPFTSIQTLTLQGFRVNYLLFALFIVLLLQPASVLIRKLTQKMADQLKENEGIKNAGRHIGYIERMLIFIFIVAGRLEVVGFILAAKSIFRFGDLQKNEERVKTEYYIIGTLLSFALACMAGLAHNRLLEL